MVDLRRQKDAVLHRRGAAGTKLGWSVMCFASRPGS